MQLPLVKHASRVILVVGVLASMYKLAENAERSVQQMAESAPTAEQPSPDHRRSLPPTQ